MRYRSKHILFMLLFAGPQAVGVATSPVIPSHHYIVSGTLHRSPGLGRSNFAIALAGKAGSQAFERLTGRGKNSPAPISITDSTGRFHVSVYDYRSFDSLRLMIILPDRGPLFGPPFPRTLATSVITEYGTFEEARGCVGCGDPSSYSVITGYRYSFPEQELRIEVSTTPF